MIRVPLIAALALAAGAPAFAQRTTDGCYRQYEQQMRAVCGAPVRRYSPEAIQRCEGELAGHRDRCVQNVAAFNETYARRQQARAQMQLERRNRQR